MSHKHNGVNYSKTIPAVERRRKAIKRLEAQLETGTKPQKNEESLNHLAKTKGLHGYIPLNDGDIKRITKEIETLKARV